MSFSFYRVDTGYCDFLRKQDPCVPHNMESKAIRPFIGIVFSINGFNYYAPLTSPKPKHLQMKNQADFFKINGGVWGAINFNNMIPVHNNSLQKVDIENLPLDTKSNIDYKNLLTNQLTWCNANQSTILRQAEKLYVIVSRGRAWPQLAARCCNFPIDEQQYLVYCQKHGFLESEKPRSIKDRMAAAKGEANRRNGEKPPAPPKPKDQER